VRRPLHFHYRFAPSFNSDSYLKRSESDGLGGPPTASWGQSAHSIRHLLCLRRSRPVSMPSVQDASLQLCLALPSVWGGSRCLLVETAQRKAANVDNMNNGKKTLAPGGVWCFNPLGAVWHYPPRPRPSKAR